MDEDMRAVEREWQAQIASMEAMKSQEAEAAAKPPSPPKARPLRKVPPPRLTGGMTKKKQHKIASLHANADGYPMLPPGGGRRSKKKGGVRIIDRPSAALIRRPGSNTLRYQQ